jgi:Tfp pilus assembly protein PilF
LFVTDFCLSAITAAGAEQDFSRVIEIQPKASVAYFNRALVFETWGDYARALQDYDTAAELNVSEMMSSDHSSNVVMV